MENHSGATGSGSHEEGNELALAAVQERSEHQQPPSQVEKVLSDASRDLENADVGPAGFIVAPIRDNVLLPVLGVSCHVLPAVTTAIPFADAAAAFGLSLVFNTVRAGYGILHGESGEVLAQWRTQLAEGRLCTFVAEEIARNCNQASTDDLAKQFVEEQDGSFTYRRLVIDAPDGTPISATVMEPIKDGKVPVVIFVNSWTCTEHEYIILAARLAKQGYLVMNYCTRGFGASGGLVNVAGPKDREDMGAMLDWLEDNTRADMNNVGITGISYGGGLSLIGVATQDRIKTAAALGGWGDIAASLYGNETPRLVWAACLLASGYMAGDMDPIAKKQLNGIIVHENIDEILEWAADRSAISFIDRINSGNKPVYMAQSFGDDLFNPNQAFHFFESLTGPKRLDMSQGIHGFPEIFGVTGGPNYVWENVFKWFDYHLKGKKNDIMDVKLTTEVKLTSRRDQFANWPSPQTFKNRFYLKPRGLLSNGTLSSSQNDEEGNTTITCFKVGSGAVSGIPFVSNFAEAQLHQPIPSLLGINRLRSIVYYSESLESTMKIRGAVTLNLTIASSIAKAQVVAYLYDDVGSGLAKLISHGVITEHSLTPHEEYQVTIAIQAGAYDVPRGHHLAIAIDTRDPLYAPPTRSVYSLTVVHSPENQSVLELQCIR